MNRHARARPERRIIPFGRIRPGPEWRLHLIGTLAVIVALAGRGR